MSAEGRLAELALERGEVEVRGVVSPEDFSAFVAKRRERAVRIAFRLLGGDESAAQDVAQDAFLRAFRGLRGFRGDASLDTWFYRILVREAQRQRRWWALRRALRGDTEKAPEPVDPEPQADPGLRRRIAAALERLTGAQREVFVLVHLEGFTLAEASAVTGKAIGTIKSHLHRALASLREQLGDLRRKDEEDGGG